MFRDALLPLFHRFPAFAHATSGFPAGTPRRNDGLDRVGHRTTSAREDDEVEAANETTVEGSPPPAPNATLARSCLTLNRIGAMRRRLGRY